MVHSTTIDTTELQVASVCVFQADRAEVKRVLQVDLKEGQNEVFIEKLPTCLDRDSIRVEGVGNAVIFDVVYHPPPVVNPNTTKPEERAKLKEVEQRIATLQSEKKIREDQSDVLDGYAKTMNAEKSDAKALIGFLDLFSQRKRDIHENVQAIGNQIEEVEKEAEELRKLLWEDAGSMGRKAKISVIALAATDGKASLLVSYVVSGASWTPLYDLRAQISNTPKEPSTVALQYRASIVQDTGEDWNDVELTLSTASPLLSSDIPELPQYRIGAPQPAPSPSPIMMKSMVAMAAPPTTQERAAFIEDDHMAMEYYDAPATITARTATAVEGVTSTTFVIEGKSTIPSDSDTSEQTHKVSIALIDLQAKLEWISVPKIQATTFLRCQVKNTSQYVLLPGESSVFMNNNFVCKSRISHVSPQESFSTSLGVDPSLKVTYHNLEKKTLVNSGSLLAAKHDVTSFVQRITVKNNRSTAVEPLFIKDQIPVSETSTFKVTLVQPEGLGSPKERKEVRVADGTTVRWAVKGDEYGNEYRGGSVGKSYSMKRSSGVEEEGVLEWTSKLTPGETVDLFLAFEVGAPAGRTWERR